MLLLFKNDKHIAREDVHVCLQTLQAASRVYMYHVQMGKMFKMFADKNDKSYTVDLQKLFRLGSTLWSDNCSMFRNLVPWGILFILHVLVSDEEFSRVGLNPSLPSISCMA